jgi:hypothetical protein
MVTIELSFAGCAKLTELANALKGKKHTEYAASICRVFYGLPLRLQRVLQRPVIGFWNR